MTDKGNRATPTNRFSCVRPFPQFPPSSLVNCSLARVNVRHDVHSATLFHFHSSRPLTNPTFPHSNIPTLPHSSVLPFACPSILSFSHSLVLPFCRCVVPRVSLIPSSSVPCQLPCHVFKISVQPNLHFGLASFNLASFRFISFA